MPLSPAQTRRLAAYSHAEMVALGADGHLSRGYLRYIPLDKLDGLEPVPSNNESEDGAYHYGLEITQPIEVEFNSGEDLYMVFSGNHRIAQARANRQTHILAFVAPCHIHGFDSLGVVKLNNPDPDLNLGEVGDQGILNDDTDLEPQDQRNSDRA